MPTEISEQQLQQTLSGITIPPQPQILVDIHMELAMPNPDFKHISDLVCQDTSLSGSVLKVVNTCFRHLNKQITSIKKAVDILGLKQVINIVDGLSIKGKLRDNEVVNMNRHWDSAMEVAAACAIIAKKISFQNPDAAYTLGITHNAGAALILKTHQNYNELIEEAYANISATRRIIDTENAILHTNHAVVGYYTAKSWKLPKAICEVIAEHHSSVAIFDDTNPQPYDPYKKTLLAILKLSEHFAKLYQVIGNADEDLEWELIKYGVMDHLHLDDNDLEFLLDHLNEMGIGINEQ